MAKLWAGRTAGNTEKLADDFNSSLHFDRRMYRQDIEGSIAHAVMLGKQGIITAEETEALVQGLGEILADLQEGKLAFDESCEDIHMFVEQELTNRIGAVGKKLHTARSRNDQVALDLRMYLRDEVDAISNKIAKLIRVLLDKAEKNKNAIMPGYTHMQRAQPVVFAHHLLAYAMMLLRDKSRFSDTRARINISPIGSCALAGTTYHIDRVFEAEKLGFADVCRNSIDGVSDRDFCIDFMSNCATLMMHLSRFAEELILWSSWEFRFIELSDAYTTGSSIMPQKKNPDMAELIRGKTGRVYGDLMALLTTMKGLPLAYNKDMQEDKESVFDATDTVRMCLDIMTPMIETMNVRTDRMRKAAEEGFINATDLADYLVRKGMPFRDAYRVSGSIVAECIQSHKVLESLTLETYRSYSNLFAGDLFDAIDLSACVAKRISEGGPGLDSVLSQIAYVKEQLQKK